MGKQRGQFGCGFQRGDAVEFRLERRYAELVDGGGVHAARVFVADLLFVWRTRGRGRGCLLENLPQVQPVQLVEFLETAVGGLIGRQRIAFEPAVATVFVEVVGGVDGFVDEAGIEDAQLSRGRWGGLGAGRNAGETGGREDGEYEKSAKARAGAEHAETVPDSRGLRAEL